MGSSPLVAAGGFGSNLFNTANNAVVMNTLEENRSFASGMLETTRQMGHTIGTTISATILGLALPVRPLASCRCLKPRLPSGKVFSTPPWRWYGTWQRGPSSPCSRERLRVQGRPRAREPVAQSSGDGQERWGLWKAVAGSSLATSQ